MAATRSEPEARRALNELCTLYWLPLYAFARQWGCRPEDAEDATQEFLATVAGGALLAHASPERGRLRTFLLSAFQRDLTDLVRRAGREKRGGGSRHFVSFELADAEAFLQSSTPPQSPEAAFDRAWGLACLDRAIEQLASEYGERGRGALFDRLRPFLDPGATPDYEAVAKTTGLTVNALRQAVFRLRQRLRTLLRNIVGDTLAQPTDALIDEEMIALREVLGT